MQCWQTDWLPKWVRRELKIPPKKIPQEKISPAFLASASLCHRCRPSPTTSQSPGQLPHCKPEVLQVLIWMGWVDLLTFSPLNVQSLPPSFTVLKQSQVAKSRDVARIRCKRFFKELILNLCLALARELPWCRPSTSGAAKRLTTPVPGDSL